MIELSSHEAALIHSYAFDPEFRRKVGHGLSDDDSPHSDLAVETVRALAKLKLDEPINKEVDDAN